MLSPVQCSDFTVEKSRIKGIVSRDWGGLQIVSFYGYKVCQVRFIFDFKIVFIYVELFKNCVRLGGF
jgi:hypothetical protein